MQKARVPDSPMVLIKQDKIHIHIQTWRTYIIMIENRIFSYNSIHRFDYLFVHDIWFLYLTYLKKCLSPLNMKIYFWELLCPLYVFKFPIESWNSGGRIYGWRGNVRSFWTFTWYRYMSNMKYELVNFKVPIFELLICCRVGFSSNKGKSYLLTNILHPDIYVSPI